MISVAKATITISIFSFKFKSLFHHGDAESAEDNDFVFAVERTSNIKGIQLLAGKFFVPCLVNLTCRQLARKA